MQDNPEDRDAEARVNAVKGLVSVCETLTKAEESASCFSGDGADLFLFIKNEVMCSLLKTLDDYSTDNRGDVGSWIREAAMDGLERCTYILCKRDSMNQEKGSILAFKRSESSNDDHTTSSYFDPTLANNLVGGIVKQAVEKMDKLREAAAMSLQRILYNKTTFVPHIPHREILEDIVPDEAEFKWAVS